MAVDRECVGGIAGNRDESKSVTAAVPGCQTPLLSEMTGTPLTAGYAERLQPQGVLEDRRDSDLSR